ncbi:MAG: epimerase [Oscillospiraceae bacterium]|nr:epimerase [Oscillospiraceae bacterium]
MTDKELIELLSRPSKRLVAEIGKIDGDIMILGCGGKIGPSLAAMAARACREAGVKKRVIGVSKFDYEDAPATMRDAGVEVIEADLFDPAQLAALPDVPNIIYMVGRKFGTYKNQSLTWAINVLLPAKICERFKDSRIVSFSTGNVYGFAPVTGGGFRETDTPDPFGEYGQTCLGRERVFEHYAELNGTKSLMFRLNYAIDMRYGVLYDLATSIMKGTPVNLDVSFFNCIWQGDCCEYAIRSLAYCDNPPFLLNVTGPESISMYAAALQMGGLLGREPVFSGEKYSTKPSMFSNTQKLNELMGYPLMPLNAMMRMTAEWVKGGGRAINAPTHFEATDGRY